MESADPSAPSTKWPLLGDFMAGSRRYSSCLPAARLGEDFCWSRTTVVEFALAAEDAMVGKKTVEIKEQRKRWKLTLALALIVK